MSVSHPLRTNASRRRKLLFESLEERRVLTAAPQLVFDINPAAFASSNPSGQFNHNISHSFVGANNTVFFTANDGTHGSELWKSNGTATGTALVKDIKAGSASTTIQNLTNVNGTLYFNADDGQHGSELWKSDGTAAGTKLVKDILAGTGNADPQGLVNVNGTLFFFAYDSIHSVELWKSDGTDAGTVLVKDINLQPGGTPGGPNGTSLGIGTKLFQDQLVNVNGTVFFAADDGIHGPELWKSDGTNAGTQMVKDINTNLDPRNAYGSDPRYLANINGVLFFSAHDATNGYELWKSDGTAAGTMLVKDISPVIGGSRPEILTNVNGQLFFVAEDNTHGTELWRSDGTTAGTILLKDINPGDIGSGPRGLTNVNGVLFFGAENGAHRMELWKSDGTIQGTTSISPIAPYFDDRFSTKFANVNGTLYFVGSQTDATGTLNDTGYELFKSDGTTAGTVLVQDINPGVFGSKPGYLANVNGTLFFSADDTTTNRELWKVGPLPSLSAKLSGGNLTITDFASTNDNITISRSNTGKPDLQLYNSTGHFSAAPAGGKLWNDDRTLTIPLTAITGSLILNLGDGDDAVFMNSFDSLPNSKINLGSGNDTLAVLNGSGDNIWSITGAQSGTLKIGATANITFQGLENASGSLANDIFKLTNTGPNGIRSLNGNRGPGIDSIEITRNVNMTLTDSRLTVGGTPVAQTFALANFESATLTGGIGNNTLDASLFSGPVTLSGGDGNDILLGGYGNDTIYGDNGNDWLGGSSGDDLLYGGGGRDVLVGGIGNDMLNRAEVKGSDLGDDLLISSRTIYDTNKTAIDAILASWASPLNYTAHIEQLSVTGVGSSKQFKLNSSTVADDNFVDALFGGSGLDWYFFGANGTRKDTHDKITGEQAVSV